MTLCSVDQMGLEQVDSELRECLLVLLSETNYLSFVDVFTGTVALIL